MSGPSTTAAGPDLLAELARFPGKAERIGGSLVPSSPTGHRPNQVAGTIYVHLRQEARRAGRGSAYTDTMGFIVPRLPSGRESFSPDASFYDGPPPDDAMGFVTGPPTLAVEVRSQNDQGRAAEAGLAAKRADYFRAGTAVVWDVDPRAGCIHVYRASRPDRPDTFGPGQAADAEPALPGWTIAVDEVFA